MVTQGSQGLPPLRSHLCNRFPAARLTNVYRRCMSRTNIDLDDDAVALVMRRYHLATKRDAVNFALRALAAEPLPLDQARALRGSGWEGDLDKMRQSRSA